MGKGQSYPSPPPVVPKPVDDNMLEIMAIMQQNTPIPEIVIPPTPIVEAPPPLIDVTTPEWQTTQSQTQAAVDSLQEQSQKKGRSSTIHRPLLLDEEPVTTLIEALGGPSGSS